MRTSLQSATTATRLVALFYLATPLFALLDFVGGVSVRAVVLDGSPALRALYYATVFALGLLASGSERLGPVLGIFEGGINVGMLAVGVLTAYLGLLDAAGSETAGPPALPAVFSPEGLTNLVLSALVLALGLVSVGRRGARRVPLGL